MIDRSDAITVLERLHETQNEFYAGVDADRLAELLTPEITWTVPGDNLIAGTYRGLDEVFGYFRYRRDLAQASFRMHRKDILVGEGDRLAALTDGMATLGGREQHWSTVGLYTLTPGLRIAACWLLPLDAAAFDAIWSAATPPASRKGRER